MNLKNLIWNNEVQLAEKLNWLYQERTKLEKSGSVTNTKEIPFNIYFDFSADLSQETINNQWKQLKLAERVVKIIKRWDKKYEINLKQTASPSIFIDFFKGSVCLSQNNMCTIGINYHKDKFSFKTFIIWADKLARKQIITNSKYNSFMEYLAGQSNNRL